MTAKTSANVTGVFDLETNRLIGLAAKGTGDVTYLAGQDEPTPQGAMPVTAITDPLTGGIGNFSVLSMRLSNACLNSLMASPPTVTVNTASQIVGGISYPGALIEQFPIPPAGRMTPLYIDNSPEGETGAVTRAPVDYWICTDAATFEIVHRPDGLNSDLRLYVNEGDGWKVASNVVAGNAFDNVTKYVTVATGSRKLRVWEISGLKVPFDSIRVGPTDSVMFPDVPSVRAVVTGDSFAEGTGASSSCLGFAKLLCNMLGIRKVCISGLGGTGYSGTSNGLRKRLKNRFASDLSWIETDVYLHCNGVNDGAVTPSQLRSDASDAFDLAAAANPNALQIVFPGFSPKSNLPETTRDSIRAACAGRGRFVFIDAYADGEITGTGYVNSPSGSGNSDWIVGGTDGSDQTHPTTAGHEYLSRWRAFAIGKVLPMFRRSAWMSF